MKLIATSETIEIVSTKDIIYIEAFQNYARLHLLDNSSIVANESLQSLDQHEDPLFYRIHVSYIVNIAHIRRFHKRGEVELINDKLLPIARRRKTEFIRRLEHAVSSNLLQ